MKISIFKAALALVTLLLAPVVSGAEQMGGQDGGGGGVMRCEQFSDSAVFTVRMVNGRRQYVKAPNPSTLSHNREFEFLDLWEAEVGSGPFFNHRVNLPFDGKATKDYWISQALARLALADKEFAAQAEYYLTYVRSRMFPAPAGTYVLDPSDTDIRFLPKGCSPPVGLGLYSDREDNLVYDREVMSKLLDIDRAAFELHEAIYKYLRVTTNAHSSWQTRRIVGLMLSTEPFTKAQLQPDFKW